MEVPLPGSGSTPPAPAPAQDPAPAPAQDPAPAPAQDPPPVPGRNTAMSKVGEVIDKTGVYIGSWYPCFAHTRDFFVKVGSFVPDKEISEGCPGLLVKTASAFKSIGSELGNITMCLQGASGVCALLSSAIRRLNMHLAPEEAEPQVIYFSTLEELDAVLLTWKKSPTLLEVDLDPTSGVEFAGRVELLLSSEPSLVRALFENSPTYQTRLAQLRRSLELKSAHEKGIKNIFVERYTGTPPAPPATGVQPHPSVNDKPAVTIVNSKDGVDKKKLQDVQVASSGGTEPTVGVGNGKPAVALDKPAADVSMKTAVADVQVAGSDNSKLAVDAKTTGAAGRESPSAVDAIPPEQRPKMEEVIRRVTEIQNSSGAVTPPEETAQARREIADRKEFPCV